MKHKRIYQKPTVQIVEIKKSGVLLMNSGTLEGYQYQENTNEEGWEN